MHASENILLAFAMACLMMNPFTIKYRNPTEAVMCLGSPPCVVKHAPGRILAAREKFSTATPGGAVAKTDLVVSGGLMSTTVTDGMSSSSAAESGNLVKPLLPLADAAGDGQAGDGIDKVDTVARNAAQLLHSTFGWSLAFLVGMGPWLIVNGCNTELYALIGSAPEGNKLSSQLSAATQFGNVVPFVVVILRNRGILQLETIIGVMNIVALVGGFLLAQLWDKQTEIAGWPGQHSTGLLLLVLVGGFVGCCSKVTLFPFASRLPGEAISAVSSGMGMAGLVPVVLGVAQNSASISGGDDDDGNGKIPLRFSVTTFFYVMFGFIALANVSFVVLLRAERAAKRDGGWELAHVGRRTKHSRASTSSTSSFKQASVSAEFPSETIDLLDPEDMLIDEANDETGVGSSEEDATETETATTQSDAPSKSDTDTGTRPEKASLTELLLRGVRPLVNMLFVAALNYAVFPAMLPFMVGKHNPSGVLWLTSGYYAANLAGRWMPTFIKFYKLELLNALQISLYIYFFWSSAVAGFQSMAALMVTLVIFSFNNGFSATMVYESIRIDSRTTDREFLLQTAGICGQIGSFVGTFLTVFIISRGVFDDS